MKRQVLINDDGSLDVVPEYIYSDQQVDSNPDFGHNYRPFIKNSLNYRILPIQGERSLLPSVTLPNQVLTIPQILQQYTQGIQPTSPGEPMYSDLDLPDPRTLDLSELEMYNEIVHQRIKEYKENYNDDGTPRKKDQPQPSTPPEPQPQEPIA